MEKHKKLINFCIKLDKTLIALEKTPILSEEMIDLKLINQHFKEKYKKEFDLKVFK